MIDVMSEIGWEGVSKDAILLAVKNDPSIIWDLPEVDESIFRAVIEVDPAAVFDEWGELHFSFSLEKYPVLVDRIFELIAGCSLRTVGDPYRLHLKALSKEWRVLSLLPNADEELKLAAVKNDFRALSLIEELTPALQLLALDDLEERDRVFFHCGQLLGAVARKAKSILLDLCQVCPNPNWGYPYAEKYLSLASEREAKKFLCDPWLSEMVNLNEFIDEPTDRVKKFLIKKYGFEFYQILSPDRWSLSDDLMEWVLGHHPEMMD